MKPRRSWLAVGLLLALTARMPAAETEALFHRAYYLEVEDRNPEAAIPLYERVVADSKAPPELAAKARERLEACRKRTRLRDLSRLMPPETFAYVELREPGRHLAHLVAMLGLSGSPQSGQPGPGDGARWSALSSMVSPRLLRSLGCLEGVAVGLTDVDLRREEPAGVVVLNAGSSDLIHGLVETAISSGVLAEVLRPDEPVHGFPSWSAPFGRIVAAGPAIVLGYPARLAVDTVGRLARDGAPSLAANPAFDAAAEERASALSFAWVDPRRIVSMVRAEVEEEARRYGRVPEEFQILDALVDLDSLRSATWSLGVSDGELRSDFRLALAEQNHALLYHFFRTPPIGREALAAVPGGVAAFIAFGLSEEKADPGAASRRDRLTHAVTGLDIGREVFSNISDVALFALPGAPAARDPYRPSIPSIGLVLRVKDAARSHALWSDLLGIPATLLGAQPSPVSRISIEGRDATVYAFPEGVRVFFAPLEDRVVLALTPDALAAALRAAKGQGNLLGDEAFAARLSGIDRAPSKVVGIEGGRFFHLLVSILGPPGEGEEELILQMFSGASLVAITHEEPSRYHEHVALRLPALGSVAALIARKLSGVRHTAVRMARQRVVETERAAVARSAARRRSVSSSRARSPSNASARTSSSRRPPSVSIESTRLQNRARIAPDDVRIVVRPPRQDIESPRSEDLARIAPEDVRIVARPPRPDIESTRLRDLARIAPDETGTTESSSAPAIEFVEVPSLPTPPAWDRARVRTLVAKGSRWRYLDDGSDASTAWRRPDFDDSGWKAGAAPLGYGDDGLASEVSYGPDEQSKAITTYFRRSFTVDRPGELDKLVVLLRRDDGAAVYINGREVVRDNLAEAAGARDAAPGIASGPVETWYFPWMVDPDALRPGENTIAVEVHQANPTSSDIAFDLALEALGRAGARPDTAVEPAAGSSGP